MFSQLAWKVRCGLWRWKHFTTLSRFVRLAKASGLPDADAEVVSHAGMAMYCLNLVTTWLSRGEYGLTRMPVTQSFAYYCWTKVFPLHKQREDLKQLTWEMIHTLLHPSEIPGGLRFDEAYTNRSWIVSYGYLMKERPAMADAAWFTWESEAKGLASNPLVKPVIDDFALTVESIRIGYRAADSLEAA